MQWKHFSAGATRVAAALGAGCVVVAVGIVAASTASATASPTIAATCVKSYDPLPSVGVTTLSWTSAPTGAQVKVVGFVTEYRDASTSSGSVLFPGLPLDSVELEKYEVYLVDSSGATVAGPTGLALCGTPTATATATATGTTTATATATPTATATATGTPTATATATGTPKTTPKTTPAKSPKIVVQTDGGELGSSFGLVILVLSGLFGFGLFGLYRLARR